MIPAVMCPPFAKQQITVAAFPAASHAKIFTMQNKNENKSDADSDEDSSDNAQNSTDAAKTKQSDFASNNKTEKLWSPTFIIVTSIALFGFITSQGTNSGTSVYIVRMGGTAAYAGVLTTIYALAETVARFIIGPVLDAKGRSIVMRVGAIIVLVATVCPIIVPFGDIFVLWRIMFGFGFALVTTAAATAAADVLPMSRLGEGIGYYGLGQAIAMSIGPALALALVATDPAENLFIGLSIPATCVVVLAFCCRYEKHPEIIPETSTYRRQLTMKHRREGNAATEAQTVHGIQRFLEKRALPGAIPIMFAALAMGFNIAFVGLYGATIGITNSGLYFTISAITMILVRLRSRAFMGEMKPIRVVAIACSCGIVAFALLLLAGEADVTWAFFVAGAFYGVYLGLINPICQTVAVKGCPPERWGTANSMFSLLSGIGFGVSTSLWGFTNDTMGFSVSIACVMASIAITWIVAWICFPANAKSKKRRRAS